MDAQTRFVASATAPVNIAVVKYWGKRDASLNLPTNSSLSVTLSPAQMCAHTTASADRADPALDPLAAPTTPDVLVLNGADEPITGRTAACLAELRSLRARTELADGALPRIAPSPLRIVSRNNFPTAAGLASSAAGFAALVKAVAELYKLDLDPTRLSTIARQGSGSACRSLFGGYVAWEMGTAPDGLDSRAIQVAPAAHWPQMRALILVASAAKKDVGSTIGMQRTAATSQLFAHRISSVVPEHMRKITAAIQARDFTTFANVTMRDSNSFHACCLDSVPPIFYMTDASRAAVSAVHALNDAAAAAGQGPVAAYTFDAGPNAVIYFLQKDGSRLLQYFSPALDKVSGWSQANASVLADTSTEHQADTFTLPELDSTLNTLLATGIKSVIFTSVGEGAQPVDEHLE